MSFLLNPYVFAGEALPPFDPLTLPSLNRWYDPSDAATLTSSGGDVSQMNDKSGNNFHISQSDATRRPSTGATINGVAALSFDGVDEYLLRNSDLAAFTGEDKPFTAFMVCEPTTLLGQYLFTFNRSTGGAYQTVLIGGQGPAWMYRKLPNSGSLNQIVVNKTPQLLPSLITAIHTGTVFSLRWNGELIQAATSSNVSSQTVDRFVLGAHLDNATLGAPFTGKVGEFILCSDDLSAGDIDDAEAYLMNKWGIVAVPPATEISASIIKPAVFVSPGRTREAVSSIKHAVFSSPGRTREAVSSIKHATFIEIAPRAELTVNFTGADGSTSFSDLSPQAKTLTALGNAQILSNKLELDGTGDWVSVPDSDAFSLNQMDFTVEMFGVEFDTVAATQAIVGHYHATGNQRGWFVQLDSATGNLQFSVSPDGTATSAVAGTFGPAIVTPYDLAVVRHGTSVYFYVNGTRTSSPTLSSRHIFNSTAALSIGALSAGTQNVMNGRIAAIRITSNEAKYTGASYTVPTLPLT